MRWLIALLRAWLGIRADIQEKQQERVGQVVQENADLKAGLAVQERMSQDTLAVATESREQALGDLRDGKA